MINWIIGGVIFIFTAFIIIRSVNRIRKGESCCSSGGCASGNCCGCDKK